jgi:hypothetical protein
MFDVLVDFVDLGLLFILGMKVPPSLNSFGGPGRLVLKQMIFWVIELSGLLISSVFLNIIKVSQEIVLQ